MVNVSFAVVLVDPSQLPVLLINHVDDVGTTLVEVLECLQNLLLLNYIEILRLLLKLFEDD